jgi:hypothetical protein
LFAGTLLPIQLRGPDTVLYHLGYVVFILIVAGVIFFYPRTQFDLKNEARVNVAASMQLSSELLAMDEDEFDSGKFFQLPDDMKDSQYDSEEILPPILLERADTFRRPSRKLRASDKTRLLCYMIILIMTAGLLAARFIL